MEDKNRIYASVRLLDVPFCLDKPYAYYVPAALAQSAVCGALVTVPFGGANRKTAGVITELRSECELDPEKIKPLFEVSAAGKILDSSAMEICSFLCSYTLCTYGEAVRAVTPSAVTRLCEYYCVNEDKDIEKSKKLSEKALLLYNYIRSRGSVQAGRLKVKFGDDASELLASLIKLKLIKKEFRTKEKQNIRFLTYVSPAAEAGTLRSPLQGRIMEILKDSGRISTDELYALLGKNAAPQLSSLEKKGLVTLEKVQNFRSPYLEDAKEKETESSLSEEQRAAYEKINGVYEKGEAAAVLLHGVTGSGKTRVIKAMIDRVVADRRGVIMLVPEISLTPQTVSFFCGCFGDRVAVIHSSLSEGERFDAWKRIKDGLADIVIGTRSAIFAPVKNLGMIVIDEEQEHTYKSDTDPKYLAHDVARFRCGKEKALMLLSSATPSLNSYHKAVTGVYTLVEMKKRYGKATLPEVVICDMRAETEGGNVSPVGSVLADSLRETYNDNKQSIVFLNRRGYNSAVTCRICGEAIKCPGCSVSLTYHTKTPLGSSSDPEDYLKIRAERGSLSCHYCGYRTKVPKVCPSCGAEHFRFIGCGTQQAEEELSKIVPGAKILRMDADTTQTKNSHKELLNKFREGKADILLGTQMVTKGHDFPRVTLVGVLNADASLYLDDFRAAERTFSMLTQVIGRAGRAEQGGVAVVQTANPDSEVIRLAAAQDFRTFYEKEIRLRRALTFPPFCDIAVLTLSSRDESLLAATAPELSGRLKELLAGEFSDVEAIVFGPFEAPVYKVQNTCRMRVIIKCRLSKRTRAMVRQLLYEFQKSGDKNLVISADFNPSSL
ncbi:MAG: primosomal protein N' [Clostridia bacterium]|nr:primosomal protein N' [Clostridia bacterium]